MDFVNLFDSEEEAKELEELKEKIYSTKIQIPQYTPSEVCPSLSECHKLDKYYDLQNLVLWKYYYNCLDNYFHT